MFFFPIAFYVQNLLAVSSIGTGTLSAMFITVPLSYTVSEIEEALGE
jgi:hypothetical protein